MLPLVMSNPYKQAISSIIYTNIEHYHTHLTTMEVMEFQNYGQNCGQLGTVLAGAETIKTDTWRIAFMIKILHCTYNIDTASVEVTFSDGSMLSIYCPAVDDELDLNMSQQADLDWIMYNKPLEYAQLILSGEVMDYFQYSPLHGLED